MSAQGGVVGLDDYVLPHELHEAARRCWLRHAAVTSRSQTQRQVEVALRKLNLRCVAEWRTADGLFAVDIMAQDGTAPIAVLLLSICPCLPQTYIMLKYHNTIIRHLVNLR
eukprot:scaffold240856_cov41-Prasinocladus_malaysianus.AAC.1